MKKDILYNYYLNYLKSKRYSNGQIKLFLLSESYFITFKKRFENDEKFSVIFTRDKKINDILDETNWGNVKFYDGIDVEYVSNYSEKKLIVIFIDNWDKEVIANKRDNAIDSILDENIYDLNKLENIYIVISN